MSTPTSTEDARAGAPSRPDPDRWVTETPPTEVAPYQFDPRSRQGLPYRFPDRAGEGATVR